MTYRTTVALRIKREHMHSHYRKLLAGQGAMGFQVLLNMVMTRWVPPGSGIKWAAVSSWAEALEGWDGDALSH